MKEQDIIRIIANNLTLAGGDDVGVGLFDDVDNYKYWGFSCTTNKAGTLEVQYSHDNITWNLLDTFPVTGNKDQVYKKTRRYYLAVFTDTSMVQSTVDLSTIKGE